MKQMRYKFNFQAKITIKLYYQITLIVRVLTARSNYFSLNKKKNSSSQYNQSRYKNHQNLSLKNQNRIFYKNSSQELKFYINKINLLIERLLHPYQFNNRVTYLQSGMLLALLAKEMIIKTRKCFKVDLEGRKK